MTREDVSAWLDEYAKLGKNPKQNIHDFVHGKVDGLNLPDAVVNTAGRDHLPATMPLADLILDDLKSYPNAPSS